MAVLNFVAPFPLSIGGAISMFIEAIIVFIVLLVVDELIIHQLEIKKSFILALALSLVSYFVIPVIIAYVPFISAIPFAFYIIPLIVWIILGEILLSGEMKQKLMVAVIAFVVYTILTFIGLPMMISGFIRL
jgi:hypothetical protein